MVYARRIELWLPKSARPVRVNLTAALRHFITAFDVKRYPKLIKKRGEMKMEEPPATSAVLSFVGGFFVY